MEVLKDGQQLTYVIATFPMIVRGELPPLPKGYTILDLETEPIPEGVDLKSQPTMFPRVRIAGIGYRGRYNIYSCRRGSYLGNYICIIDDSGRLSNRFKKEDEKYLDYLFCDLIVWLLGGVTGVKVYAWNSKGFEEVWFRKHGFEVCVEELSPKKYYPLLKYEIENKLYEKNMFLWVVDERLKELASKLGVDLNRLQHEYKELKDLVDGVVSLLKEKGYKEYSEKLCGCSECRKKWGAFIGFLSEIFGNPKIDNDTKIELSTMMAWKNGYDVVSEAIRLIELAEKGRIRELEGVQASQLLEILASRPNTTITILSHECVCCKHFINETYMKKFGEAIPEIEEYSKETERDVNEYLKDLKEESSYP